LLEGSAKTPRMETGARVIGHAARPRQVKHKCKGEPPWN
jgi:hypothetical protein